MQPSDYFDRNVKIGSSNTWLGGRSAGGTRSASTTSCWGNDFPHPEGTWPYTRRFLKDRFWDVPDRRRDASGCSASTTPTSTASTSTSGARSPTASAPTPEDLGQTDASVFGKWDELREVGRPWLTGGVKEAAGAGMH